MLLITQVWLTRTERVLPSKQRTRGSAAPRNVAAQQRRRAASPGWSPPSNADRQRALDSRRPVMWRYWAAHFQGGRGPFVTGRRTFRADAGRSLLGGALLGRSVPADYWAAQFWGAAHRPITGRRAFGARVSPTARAKGAYWFKFLSTEGDEQSCPQKA